MPARLQAGALLHLEQGKGASPTYCYKKRSGILNWYTVQHHQEDTHDSYREHYMPLLLTVTKMFKRKPSGSCQCSCQQCVSPQTKSLKPLVVSLELRWGSKNIFGMPKGGLEPPCPFEHNALNVACLPISPLRLIYVCVCP